MRATAGVDELIEIALYWVHPVCTSKASTVPGLKWKKLDLHVHTPASDCFCKAESNIAPEDVVAAACAQGLGGIAVTDHMTGAWVDRVCEAASDTGLIVFPGVELSVHNYHVIALFPHDYGGKDIEGLLGACGVLPGDYGRTDKPITRDPLEVLEEIHLRGGLAVLAHIDCEHTGAWHTAGKASVRKALFNSHAYDAVEVQGESLPDELCIESVAKNRGFARFPAWYRASDNPHPEDITKHSLLGIGIAYTHFKGEESFTLESLRQCFQDPEQRIRQQDQPTTVPHPCIKRVEIRGGYLDGVSCVFHDELTSIVGGKGVGKSLLVECIRLALGDVSGVDSIAEDHRSKIAGQLGVGSQVTLQCVSSAGTEYNIEVEIDATTGESEDSDYDATARITSIETNEPVDVQASDILPLTAFSQGEIVEISREKSEQLLQLDSFVDLQEVNEKIEVLTTDLQTCVDGLVASLGARDAAANLASRSSKLKEDLKAVEDSLDADIFSEYKEYEAANELIKKALDSWQGVISPVAEAGEAVDLWTPLEQSSELCQPHLAGIRTRQEQAREGVREILARLTK